MFLLRCVFWLSIVYASMSFGGGALGRHGGFDAVVADGRASVGAVATHVAESAATICKGRELQCLHDAAQMTSLVQSALRQEDDSESIVQDGADVPLPPPAPRRHVAAAMLTSSR